MGISWVPSLLSLLLLRPCLADIKMFKSNNGFSYMSSYITVRRIRRFNEFLSEAAFLLLRGIYLQKMETLLNVDQRRLESSKKTSGKCRLNCQVMPKFKRCICVGYFWRNNSTRTAQQKCIVFRFNGIKNLVFIFYMRPPLSWTVPFIAFYFPILK